MAAFNADDLDELERHVRDQEYFCWQAPSR